jgi:hypothetical protein
MDTTRTDDAEAVFDRRLRQALEPRPEAVDRLVRRALAAPPRRTVFFRLVPAVTGLSALLALLALALLVQMAPRRQQAVSIENVGEVMIVRPRQGGRWLIRNTRQGESPAPTGSVIVIHGGGNR